MFYVNHWPLVFAPNRQQNSHIFFCVQIIPDAPNWIFKTLLDINQQQCHFFHEYLISELE